MGYWKEVSFGRSGDTIFPLVVCRRHHLVSRVCLKELETLGIILLVFGYVFILNVNLDEYSL